MEHEDFYDSIDNQNLIANGLQHIAYELSLPDPSYFRIAREGHLVLYRSMIECLKGSANTNVTAKPPKRVLYEDGEGTWFEIHRLPAPGCHPKKAWVFSEPVPIQPQAIDLARSDDQGDRLISFYDALAMVQTRAFMGHYTHSKPVPVSAQAMPVLEWLHERVRNPYEHFVPKRYAADIKELLDATEVCLRLSRELLLASGNALIAQDVKDHMDRLFTMLPIRVRGAYVL